MSRYYFPKNKKKKINFHEISILYVLILHSTLPGGGPGNYIRNTKITCIAKHYYNHAGVPVHFNNEQLRPIRYFTNTINKHDISEHPTRPSILLRAFRFIPFCVVVIMAFHKRVYVRNSRLPSHKTWTNALLKYFNIVIMILFVVV